MNSKYVKNIIWGIDPFEESLPSRSQLISVLQRLAEEENAFIEPVYVLNLAFDEAQAPEMDRTQLVQYREAAEKAANECVKEIRSKHFLPARVLAVDDSSAVSLVQTLVNYASSKKALFIGVSTHARHGLSRLFLGSFVETLLLHSYLPVITVSPECLKNVQQNQILFATDFSESSAEAYKNILSFAKTLNAEIVLLHILPRRMEPILQAGAYLFSGSWVSTPEYLTEEEGSRRQMADRWAEKAQMRGVKIKIHFQPAQNTTSEAILEQAKSQNVAWIAMAAESGSVTSALLGSITRQVVRDSNCPVYVVRPEGT